MTRTTASIIVVACSVAALAARQAPPQPPTFRVTVDAVSIDAVVTDRNGEVVRDLTAADFEVFQSGKRQRVTFAHFVPVLAAAAPASGAVGSSRVPAASAGGAPPAPAPPITRDQVQRTIVVVVDDLGLSVQGMNDTRLALRRFVDTGLLPTDLVAIVRTGESNGLLQSLTNDRGALEAAADALRYNICSRKGVSPVGDVNQMGMGLPHVDDGGLHCMIPPTVSLAALTQVVQAARDMPGRKTVIFASEGFGELEFGTHPTTMSGQDPYNVRDALDRAIDQAARSGVVIYAIDSTGLQTGGLRASDNLYAAEIRGNTDALSGQVRGLAAMRQRNIHMAQESLGYLAEQTGGFAVVNTNDLAAGLGRISHDVRDYYVIGYEPGPDTFAPQGKPPRLHTITVKVNRPGVQVKTRKAFIGVSDPEPPSAPLTPAQDLVRAAMSPFSDATIGVHATYLPGYSPERGLFVRTVLHLDAQALAFSTGFGGIPTATVDLVGLVFDTDGAQVHDISTGFDIRFEGRAAGQAVKDGFVYTVRVPIDRPGGYQLRYAVRDRTSGAIGSAGGFVNVPDVAGGALALSGVVLRQPAGTLAGVGADAGPRVGESLDSDRFSVPPVDALRVYAPGTPLSYSYEIYNAGAAVQVETSLWRGAEKLVSLPPDTLVPPSGGGPFAAAGGVTLADDLPAGTYVLQIAATSDDPNLRRGSGGQAKHAKKTRAAVQRITFDVEAGLR